MAASTLHFALLFFLALLSSSYHTHAREIRFFGKVTAPAADRDLCTSYVPIKDQRPLTKQVEIEPNFSSESDTQNHHGDLHGQESYQFSPNATMATATETTSTAPSYTATKFQYENNYFGDHLPEKGYTIGNDNQEQGQSDTRFGARSFSAPHTSANTDNYYSGVDNYNSQQQGMSDTRFLENGKYHYDLSNESGYHPEFPNNQGYYGDNVNSFEYKNSRDGYKNHEEFKEYDP